MRLSGSFCSIYFLDEKVALIVDLFHHSNEEAQQYRSISSQRYDFPLLGFDVVFCLIVLIQTNRDLALPPRQKRINGVCEVGCQFPILDARVR